MRNPNRIRKLLNLLADIWEQYPDMRLGQLIYNCVIDMPDDENKLFYIEDDKLIEDMINLMSQLNANPKKQELINKLQTIYKRKLSEIDIWEPKNE